MIKPSLEQVNILNALRTPEKAILRISAVAGSGKTTTNLYLASELKDKKILLLTYNKFLAEETRTKIIREQLTNLEVRTFHGFAGTLFGSSVYNDDILIELLRNQRSVGKSSDDRGDQNGQDDPIEIPVRDYSMFLENSEEEYNKYDIIVFDEVQDLTLPLYHLCKYIYDLYVAPFSNVRLMLFGDPRQCIYGYNGADSRYMSFAGTLFGSPVIDLTLNVSYRVTDQVATFINEICYGGQHIISGIRQGPLPNVIIQNKRNAYKYVSSKIISLVNSGIDPEEIFILAPSAKIKKFDETKKNICNMLTITNELASHGIMSFIDTDGYTADHKCLSKKVVVSSIHKAKGRERKYVFFIGFDHTYFKYYSQDYKGSPANYSDGRLIMPNELYVALTRSSHELWLIAQSEVDSKYIEPIEFIDRSIIQSYANCRHPDTKHYFQSSKLWVKIDDPKKRSMQGITDLIRSLPAMIKNQLKDTLRITVLREPGTTIKMTSLVKERDPKYGIYHEDVSDINGIASVLCALRDDLTIKELFDYCLAEYDRVLHLHDPEAILTESKKIQSEYIGHNARTRQLVSNSWLSERTLQRLSARIRGTMPIGIVEKDIAHDFGIDDKFIVAGRIDNIYGNSLYEIKTKSGVSIDDHIQLALYRIILDRSKYDPMVSMGVHAKRRSEHLSRAPEIGSVVSAGDHHGPIIAFSKKDGVITAKVVSFIDGSIISVKDPAHYGPYYISTLDGTTKNNVLYNCRDDSMYSVEIIDPEKFVELVFQKTAVYDDHNFLRVANIGL